MTTAESSVTRIRDRIKPDTLYKVVFEDSDDDGNDGGGRGVNTPRYVVAYWSIRGLGAPLRMMLHAAQVNHWVAMYDVTEEKEKGGGGYEKRAYFQDKEWLKSEHNPFMNLPYLVDCHQEDDTDKLIVQTNAVFSHLGRQLNMMGQQSQADAKSDNNMTTCDELLCEVMDLRNKMVQFAYGAKGTDDEIKEKAKQMLKPKGYVQTILDKFEMYLNRKYGKSNGGSTGGTASDDKVCYLVGTYYSAPDFHLWEMLDQFNGLVQHFSLSSEKVEDGTYTLFSASTNDDDDTIRPYLALYYKNFANLPEMKRYLQSSIHTELPYNNPYAGFGSDPTTKRYVYGQAMTPWKGKGTVIVKYKKIINNNEDSTTAEPATKKLKT